VHVCLWNRAAMAFYNAMTVPTRTIARRLGPTVSNVNMFIMRKKKKKAHTIVARPIACL